MKKVISILKQWFTWHFFPRSSDLSVKSVVETILYGIVFGFCCFLFYNWNKVPVRHESITVDVLSCPQRPRGDIYDIAPVAHINYCIPMTDTDWEPEDRSIYYRKINRKEDGSIESYDHVKMEAYSQSEGYSVLFTQWNINYRKDDITGEIVIDPLQKFSFDEALSIRNKETEKTEFWKYLFSYNDFFKQGCYPYDFTGITSKDYLYNQPGWLYKSYGFRPKNSELRNKFFHLYISDLFKDVNNKRDSIIQLFYLYTDSLAKENTYLQECISYLGDDYYKHHPLYYVKHEQTQLNAIFKVQRDELELIKSTFPKFAIFHKIAGTNSVIEEGVTNGDDGKFGGGISFQSKTNFWSDSQYQKPGWFRLEDISQAYYDVKLNSVMIDSIVLTFDFVGATTFSKMSPEPDEITMSSITFSDPEKMLDIRLHGLKFHARFVELENRQYIRLFAITAIMGGMVTIFLALFIIGGLNLTKMIKDHITAKRLPTKVSQVMAHLHNLT